MSTIPATKIQIYISSDKVSFMNNSLHISSRIEERTTCSFSVFDEGGKKVFRKGQPVEVYFNGELEFAGMVLQSTITRATPQGDRYHQIRCTDYHYAADKRAVAAAYEKTKAGDIVRDKSGERTVGTILDEEGIVIEITLEYLSQFTLQEIVDGEVDI